jgi:hypothetical protein
MNDRRECYDWSWVEARVAETAQVWCACAGTGESSEFRPPAAPLFSPEEQRRREVAYDEGLLAVEREAKRAPRNGAERLEAQRRIVAAFPRFASIALGIEGETVDLLTGGFLRVGTQFARWARRFDATLSHAEIIQACRNAWSACGMQPMFGEQMRMTPSILGYSLLYPYSDNYIDDRSVRATEKREFNARFRDRLRGRWLSPRNHREAAIWASVELIEEEYPRQRFPDVFDCLLAIHRAQEDSIAQMNGCSDREVLRISCAKGGTSVLADACLAHGWLREEESRFAFEWGVLLQLGDDLQDVAEDLRRGSATLFTRAASARKPLDSLAAQLLAFGDRVAVRMDELPQGSAMLKSLMRMSWRSLVLMAVASAHEFFRPAFLAELERQSAFRFDFLRARKRRLAGSRGLYAVLCDSFIEAGEGGDGELPMLEDRLALNRAGGADPLRSAVAVGCTV